MVSVIMSIYQEKLDWIKAAVDSIINQTYNDIELIIIVDNPEPKEGLKEYLRKIVEKDKRIRIRFNSENIGLAMCMNVAIRMSNGQYIARMDADDISHVDRLERELEYLEKNDVDLVSCQVTQVNEIGEKISDQKRICRNTEICLPYVNYVVHPTVIAKAKMFKDLGGYRNFRTSQDYDLWLRALSAGYKIKIMDDILFDYRINTHNISSKKGLEQFETSNYQRKLYYLRKKRNGEDNYSEEKFSNFLRRKHLSEKRNQRFLLAREHANLFIDSAKKHQVAMIKYFIFSLVYFPEYLISVLKRVICMKIKLHFYGRLSSNDQKQARIVKFFTR